jgi:hypothetical protein
MPDKFTSFPELPPELRDQVLESNLKGPGIPFFLFLGLTSPGVRESEETGRQWYLSSTLRQDGGRLHLYPGYTHPAKVRFALPTSGRLQTSSLTGINLTATPGLAPMANHEQRRFFWAVLTITTL